MHLLNLTLQPPTAITLAVLGNFTAPKQQEIAVCRGGTRLELLKLDASDPENQRMEVVCGMEVFGGVRNMVAFKLTGQGKDYLILSSDSGRLSILEFEMHPTPHFVSLYQETYGKTGARRMVPGQWLAADPKGRSVMVGSLDKAKLVYILNRNAEGKLFPSSPLEAHKPQAIISAMVGCDVGYDNPLYACLETSYEEADADSTGEAFERAQKMLAFYELDLGLNHVVRKETIPTDNRANLLVQVPGGQSAQTDRFEGPSGVLVCCEDHIMWQHHDAPSHRVPIPRRRNPLAAEDEEPRGIIIVAAVLHKIKGSFFFLLQSEDGDLFKVTIDHQDEDVKALSIQYFDTIPVANSLCILKSGHLFSASEFGNHALYQFLSLGDDEEGTTWSSVNYPSNGATDEPLPYAYFTPRALTNLWQADTLQSIDPVVDAKVTNLLGIASDTPQIYAVSGRGPRSTFRMLRHGLDVAEMVKSELPGTPTAVWTVKLRESDAYDSYIILSFINGTLVLAIGNTIEEVQDTGFLSSAPTIAVQQIGDAGLLQVHPHGLRHVLEDKTVNEWPCPPGRTIIAATTNKRQVVLALSSAELVYFELDPMDGTLSEYQDRKGLPANATCLSIAEVPEGRQRTPFLALTAPPSSICLAEMFDTTIDKNRPTMFLNIGLQTGVLLRTVVDTVNGELTDTRTRQASHDPFLGSQPAKLIRTNVHGAPAILALSSRSWLNYTYQDRLEFAPLIYDSLEYASSFSAEMCPDGLIGVTGNTLRIFTVPRLGTKLKQDVLPLSYTPRKMVSHPTLPYFYVIESDNRTYGPAAINRILSEKQTSGSKPDVSVLELPAEEFGRPKAESGHWASVIRVVDPFFQPAPDAEDGSEKPQRPESLLAIDLDEDEAAFSVAVVTFVEKPGELCLVVGTAKNVSLSPRTTSGGFLRLYQISADGKSLEYMHKTPIDDVPTVVCGFQGYLLAGVGKALRLYELGKKQLLRKCENNTFPTAILSINTQGSRIVVGDMQESTFFVAYKTVPNRQLLVFADDTQPRWITAMHMVDYETVACGDKFGNIFVNRLPEHVGATVDDDPTGAGILHEKGWLMGAAHKTTMLAHYNVGGIVTSLSKTPMVVGGREVLVYTTLAGSVGALIPFTSKSDVEFMTDLEMHMRGEAVSLVGRDHLSYRSYYAPVKSVIDGDLCEAFASLPYSRQQSIASDLDKTVGDVMKKLESLRTSSAF
ncbi:pre-mRNA-splicing factor rse1 [Naganishia adeliensis]|uniref:Pre-mRNA-splicing factor rse1 n=1 Tax=Naganishia adeliensis TaxID=92952 RepID=A0ACC2VN79_9TREE|nr:pre-mRNA-splicing factor rse1 [Naganishia adeliensis]